ncbi:HAD family hydrolase [Enterococcus sp. LJL128]|uniref:HAD family hydrolase n=1 Tax=Enterococcus sp. LJL51 TaxID=3416656 RepID=UPI003CF9F716
MNTIVFDVDDTVYDQQQPFRAAIKKIFPAFPCEKMHELYIRFRHHSDVTFEKSITGEWTLAYMRFFRLDESMKDLGYPSTTEAVSSRFQEAYEDELDNICMHPEVKKVFDYLSEKQIPLGIITNGPTDHQYKKVKQLQLENWVPSDNIIISQSTGYQKPDKEIFQLAAKQFRMEPETTLYIGDSFENDVVGAHNGGWQSLWFNHRLRTVPKNTGISFLKEVRTFEDLFDTVQSFV